MRTRITSGLVLAAIVLSGCGSDSTGPSGGNGCSVTLSGGLTGTYNCTLAAVAAYATSTNNWAMSISTTGTPAVAISVGSTGQPTVKSYLGTAAGALGGMTVTSGTSGWAAIAGGTGSYTLVLSNVTQVSSTANGIAYTIHGTLNSTMPSLVSGGTAITMSVTF